jgi:hypothetical protein
MTLAQVPLRNLVIAGWAGQPGEPATMFFLDPGGNALELKSFQDPRQIFAR